MGIISLDLNYSLDLLTQFTPLNRISISARINLGDQGRLVISDRVDALYLSGLEAYRNDDRDQARYYFEEALRINPRFDPAKEGIALIEDSIALDDRIRDMQLLDYE